MKLEEVFGAIGSGIDRGVEYAGLGLTSISNTLNAHEQFVTSALSVFVALLVVGTAWIMIKRLPWAWGGFVDHLENGWRAVVEWPRKRKMRREKQNQINNAVAEHLERLFDEKFHSNEWDGTTIQRLRNQYGRVNKKMLPKVDKKAGVKARIKHMAGPVGTIPGDPPPQDVAPGKMAQVFALVRRPKKTATA